MIEEWQALAWSKKLYELNKEEDKQCAVFASEILEAKERLQILEARRDEILTPIHNEQDYLVAQLTAYHTEQIANGGAKTIKLPYATLVSRISPQDYSKDDSKLKAWALSNAPEYIKQAEPVVAWGELKKQIKVVNGKAIYEPTGEVLDALKPLEQQVNYSVKVVK